MPIYPLFYHNGQSYILIQHLTYDTDKDVVIVATAPTVARSFDLPLGKVTGKKGFGFRYGDLIVRGDGYVTFNSDHVVLSGAAPRLYVYDINRTKRWKNVDITIEYMRVSENSPPSYAGLGVGVRSIHETQTSTNLVVPTYYLKHTFDGRFFFEKESKHGSSYTKQPDSQQKSYPMKPNTWNKARFRVSTNASGQPVLDGWLNDQQIRSSYVDAGKWDNTAAIKEGVSCFIRNDSVKDFRVRKFSIREIPQ